MARQPKRGPARGRGQPGASGAAPGVASKKPVPDDPPIVDPSDDPEENRQILDDCVAAVRDHRTTAMEQSALEWLSENITSVFLGLSSAARKDPSKLAEIATMRKNLLGGG